MTVVADKAIGFECEKCGKYNYEDYALDQGWDNDPPRAVMEDNVICDKCGHENRVIMEM
jgi:hypothetical protein